MGKDQISDHSVQVEVIETNCLERVAVVVIAIVVVVVTQYMPKAHSGEDKMRGSQASPGSRFAMPRNRNEIRRRPLR